MSTCEYDIRILDSASELRNEIVELNQTNNHSRLLAGYCWQWISKNDSTQFDIVFPGTDFAMKWNLTSDGSGWMIAPHSINEVGCIHTCQGLEGDYMGVIIGQDLQVENGVLMSKPEHRAKYDTSLQGFKRAMKDRIPGTQERADRLIRNTYRTLMTRGMKGTFVYCTDERVAQHLRDSLDRVGYRGYAETSIPS
jgi:DUF2075 family protein